MAENRFLKRAADRARKAAEVLKDEYRKGTEGDESPVQSIGRTATDVLKTWMAKPEPKPEPAAADVPTSESVSAVEPEADAVAGLLKKVDWRSVSASVTDSRAAERMKDLAAQVDWAAAKPVAARIGAALIAAAASGQLGGLEGRSGAIVARAIINQTGLADKVADLVARDRTPATESLRTYIDATATEVRPASPSSFDTELDQLGRALGPGDPA
jgi:hypothetical protein